MKFVLSWLVVCILMLGIFTASVFVNPPINIFFADLTRTALLNLANQSRISLGMTPLIENSKLDQAARLKAEDMVQNQYFSHTSPYGTTPWYWFSKADYEYKYAGENLAIGFFESSQVYEAWLNSPSHRANLLNPNYKEIGTAILQGFGQNNAIVVVQLFGSQQIKEEVITPKPEPEPKPAPEPEPVPEPEPEPAQQQVLSQSVESFNMESIIYGLMIIIGSILIMACYTII